MLEFLRKEFPKLAVTADVPYRQLTTMGIGSVLPVLAEPADCEELAALLAALTRRGIAFFVFGAGSNVIGMDDPYPGVGIRLGGECFRAVRRDGNRLFCGSAVRLPGLASEAAAMGLGGLSPLGGIPGTLGGAAKMNAGANGATFGPLIRAVDGFFRDGTPYHAGADDLQWGYRTTSIPDDVVITSLELELAESTVEAEQELLRQELARRKEREPAGRSAGCTFRNVSELEPAGKLIDLCGLRGRRIGDVMVSEKHANYLLNAGSATERDYCALSCAIRHAVAEKFGFFLTFETKMLNPETRSILTASPAAPRVNVLYGGDTSEREVSLRSGKAVADALVNAGFQVELTDYRPEDGVTESMRRCDMVYPVLHGGFGEGGGLQKLLEDNEIRFCCSGSKASDLMMDKIATKKLLDHLRIPTAKWTTITAERHAIPADLTFPLILKVPREGSTVGIIKVDGPEGWDEAAQKELTMAPEILVEEFIPGVELTIPVLLGTVLDAIEIRSPNGFYDYDAKYLYKCGHTQYFSPPVSLDKETVDRARETALFLYHAAGCRDLLRIDFIVNPQGVAMVLEGNSLPGCTATSLVPKAARAAGISFEKMTGSLVYAALKRPAQCDPADSGTVPAAKSSAMPNPLLVRSCRWLLRAAILLAAVLLISLGVTMFRAGMTWVPMVPLFGIAVLLLVAEPIHAWLGSLEEK